MNIGLIDVDSHNFPNLALMKLSAWHKQQGDTVEWYSGIEHYDRVYMSKVFAFSLDDRRVVQADEVCKGGSGYKMFDQWLPSEIEHICPTILSTLRIKKHTDSLPVDASTSAPFVLSPGKKGLSANTRIYLSSWMTGSLLF